MNSYQISVLRVPFHTNPHEPQKSNRVSVLQKQEIQATNINNRTLNFPRKREGGKVETAMKGRSKEVLTDMPKFSGLCRVSRSHSQFL